ncbi:MAG: ATP-binding protein [Acidimicrobiales bacterium]
MAIKRDPDGQLGRVRSLDDDARTVYLELQSGLTATVTSNDSPFEFEPGDVLLVREKSVTRVPADTWPEDSLIGVVRLKLNDLTLIDTHGQLKRTPTNRHVDYRVGNTVEATLSRGVSRVLSQDPIRFLDLPELDESVVDRFKTTRGTGNESFDDFGGLGRVVERARELIETPLEHHKALAEIRARPVKGVLFTGMPGTGKTMLARIIANQSGATFYEISGPEIFSKWLGQSEELLRRIFESASRDERAIVFFDEIDSVATQRADEAHEASRRMVAQLLTLMDGFTSDDNVVVIATTNRPQDIDTALRRPGRFDWEIEFPMPNRRDRESILRASARRLSTDEPLSYGWIAEQSEAWSAADLSAIWTEAALLAVVDSRSAIANEDLLGGFERVQSQRQRLVDSADGGSQ